MSEITQSGFTGNLPANFFTIGQKPYANLPFNPEEDIFYTRQLFDQEKVRNGIELFTNGTDLRLVGIFPHEGEEAYFGFWETSNDLAKNREAFSLLEKEAIRRGYSQLIGPMNFNTFHNYRLRLAEPSWQKFDREPVNPPYYPGLLKELGFEIRSTFESRLVNKEAVPEVYLSKQQFLEELQKIPFDFIPVNPQTWAEFEDEIYELVQVIFSRNPAYKPISREQFRLLYNTDFAARLCPHSSVIFRDKASGRFAALSFCPPNYQGLELSPGVKPVYERDFPKLQKKTLLAKTVGVHPDFRQQGLMSYLAAYAMYSFRELYEEVIFCLMRSDNFSTHFTNGLPYEAVQYALFQKQLASAD